LYDWHWSAYAGSSRDIAAVQEQDSEHAFCRFVELRGAYAASLGALGRRLHIKVDERGAKEEDSAPFGD
jgi:hypothetical protein